MTISEILATNNRSLKDVTKIYRGLDHHCRCGCGGKYHSVDSRGFKIAITKMSKSDFEPVAEVEIGPNYINIPYDYDKDLCYCIYFD